MGKLDEMVDDFLFKAKNAADFAGQKTGEMVEFSKLKYQIKQAQWDIEKGYAKLGAFVYESKKSAEDFSDLISLAVNEIDLLSEKLENLEQQLLACKKVVKCSSCGRENALSSFYCARCGASLAEERAKAETEAQEAAREVEELKQEQEGPEEF